MAENNLCQLTREVQRQTFTALECHLYLNTHPDCQEAAAAFAKACEKLDAARTAYNEAAPLTPCAAAGSRNSGAGAALPGLGRVEYVEL